MSELRSDARARRRVLGPSTARWLNGIALFLGLAAAIRCSESRTSTAPRLQVLKRASLAIQPSFAALPSGAPHIDLSRIRGVLLGAGGDSVVSEAVFQGDSAILVFTVQFTGTSGVFQVDLTAYDSQGQVAFHGVDTVTVKPGDNPPVAPAPLQYAGPDAGVTRIQVVPDSVSMNAGSTGGLAVIGFNASGQQVSAPVRAAWQSRSPAVAAVDASSGLITAGPSEASTWVVATAITGATDSALVRVHAPVASFSVQPNPADVVRGDSLQLTPVMQDAAGHAIVGRSVRWTISDETKATISATGMLHGIALGGATVSAYVEGKSVDVPVTVVSPVDHIEATPNPLAFASLGEQHTLAITVVPRQNASLAGVATSVVVADPTVVSMDSSHVLTALKNGSTSITIKADVASLTVPVTVKQVATTVTVSPKTFSAGALGQTQQFTAAVLDARSQPVVGASAAWRSDNTAVVQVDATGRATSGQDGSAHVIASFGSLADSAAVTVKRVPVRLVLTLPQTTLQVGQNMTVTASLVDANGATMPGAVTFGSSDTTVLKVYPNGLVVGVSAGSAAVQAASGNFSTGSVVTVTSVSTMALNLSTMEKLPNGTQRLYVVDAAHNPGPYAWTVNGVANGNATYGTVVRDEVGDTVTYYAPGAVPSPATFDVCATRVAAPTQRACVSVTIKPVPTSGGDVLVFNDLNMFEDIHAITGGDNDPFFLNLVNFGGTGPRASKNGVLFLYGHGNTCGTGECDIGGRYSYTWGHWASLLASHGYTVSRIDGSLTGIDPNVKLLVLALPRTNYTNAEINVMKQFSGEGGRILFVGEWDGYYGSGISVENDFFAKMGAQMTNTGGAYDCGFTLESAAQLRSHQVTTGLANLTVACASEVRPGPNDYALVYDRSGTHVLGAVPKVDLTPLPVVAGRIPFGAPTLLRAPSTPQRTLAGPVHSWGYGPAPTLKGP